MKKNLKVALVHDSFPEFGGAERVVKALHQIWPEAPLYTAFINWDALGDHAKDFADCQIHESFIARLPFYKKLASPYRIFAQKAFESFDLSEYDLVISSSNAYMAKAVKVPNGVHVCYCHTPSRSLYGYITMTDWRKNPLTRVIGTIINHFMRLTDFKVAQRVNFFIANSQETKRRIKKFYRRDSTVIYPPVELLNSQSKTQPKTDGLVEPYYLCVGRLAKSKNVDLAIRACQQLGVRLKLVGSGKGLGYLQEMVGDNSDGAAKEQAQGKIEFLGAVSDQELVKLYAGATALIFPAEDEDFGIVPIEAMGQGVPVIAHRSGGPMETIIEGKTGVFFDELTVESLVTAIQDFVGKQEQGAFSPAFIKKHAQQFSLQNFQQNLQQFIEQINIPITPTKTII